MGKNNIFEAKMEWYPESHRIILTPVGYIDDSDIYEIDGGNYIVSDYKYDPTTGEFTLKLKRANDYFAQTTSSK